MSEKNYSIGELAKQTNCKVQTIRYYEQSGLLSKAVRSDANRRVFTDQHRKQLLFIRHSRELGFSLDQIRSILGLSEDKTQSCDSVNNIAKIHLQEVQFKILRLKGMEAELQRMVEHCINNTIADCNIVSVLSDHSMCHSEHKMVDPFE